MLAWRVPQRSRLCQPLGSRDGEGVEDAADDVIDPGENGDLKNSCGTECVFRVPVESVVDAMAGRERPGQAAHTAPTVRITTWRTCSFSDVYFSSAACSFRNSLAMAGLSRLGLNGPMRRPSSVVAANPLRSAHGTTVASIAANSSRPAPVSVAGSASGRRPPSPRDVAVTGPVPRRWPARRTRRGSCTPW